MRVFVGRFINEKLNYMYEFEKHPKLTEFIQEMANTGKAPREWTSFIETLNQALLIHDVVGRSEQLYCTCSRAKGLDHDEEGMPYCIECQKPVQ